MKMKLLLGATACLTALLIPRAQDPGSSAEGSSSLSDSGRLISHIAFNEWKQTHGTEWRLQRDEESGFGRFLYGGSTEPIFRPNSDQEFALLAQRAVDDTLAIHGIDSATLIVDQVTLLPLGALGSSDKMSVRFHQHYQGVEVNGGFVNVLFDMKGRLLSVDSLAIPAISSMDTTPAFDAATVQEHAHQLFTADTGLPVTRIETPQLRVDRQTVGKHIEPLLVWEVDTEWSTADFGTEAYRYRIDAKTGAVVDRINLIHHDVSGNVKAMATPGTLPDISTNPETAQNMPHLRVTSSSGNATTDINGDFTITGATAPLSVTVTFDGTYVTTNDQGTTDYSLTTSLGSASGNNVLMNPSSSALYTSEANSFLWINNLRDWTRAINPSDSTCDFNATSNVNINSTCNAYYNGVSVNFYPEGGGCRATAYSTVVVHEMGHWLNDRYSSGNGSDGFGEGNADVFAMYITNQPITGEEFRPGTDIRTGLNTRQFCGDSNPGCYGQVHADGEVLGGALWKVRARLQTTHGDATGGAIADTLFNSWMNAYNDGQIRTIIETHWLTLDDDDGNINNGTPNYVDIDAGFRDQGFPGFDLPFVVISNVTDLPTTPDEIGPYTVNADLYAEINPPLAAADMFYRVNGGSFVQVPMSFVSGTSYTADIPGQTSVAKIEYYVSGEDSLGNVEAFPANAPTGTLSFFIGVETLAIFEDFESGVSGWTHSSNNGAQDDWQHSSQVGSPNGSYGQSGDPTSAYSGTNIWGNDLGQPGWNGAYQDGVDNSLRSPSIDMSAISGATLSFQRWLTIESGQWDQGNVKVNGNTVWTNPYSTDLLDSSWNEVEVDISAYADGNPAVQLEWNLVSDGNTNFGGWNIDDVKVFSLVASPPTAGFSGNPTAGPAPHTVVFSDESIGNITTWSWDFGDTATSTDQSPSHTYAVPGYYTVSLTVAGPGGSDSHTITDYIEVTGSGTVVSHFSGTPTSGYSPLTVAFTDESLGTITGWSWDFGDTGTSTTPSPSHTYNTPGTYSVSLTVTGPGGADTFTRTNYIAVEDPTPIAGFTGSPTSGLAPLPVSFIDASSGPITTYSWNFGDGGTSALQSPTHTYNTPGTFTVSLTVTGPGGTDTFTETDYISVGFAAPVAAFSGTPTLGGLPLPVDFTDSSTGTISSWTWNFGDSGSSTAQHPTHVYNTPGTFTVTLTVAGPGGSDTLVLSDYIEVTVAASAVSRNGTGVNPDIFTSTSLPILGTGWTSEVDAGSVGANGFVFVFVYAGGIPGTPTAFGELMLDPSSAWLFTDLAIAVGGTSLHDIAVPSDPAFLGGTASAQAYLNNVAPSGQLTNAIDLVLGF